MEHIIKIDVGRAWALKLPFFPFTKEKHSRNQEQRHGNLTVSYEMLQS